VSELTWTCHICGRERPDDKISVMTKPLVFESGVVADQNVRYCNDDPSCRDMAPHFDFFKYVPDDPPPEPEVGRWKRFIRWLGFDQEI
jgi:hypothetical protein